MPKTPERVLSLQGATNFRDFGGYLGRGRRPVRWRRLFRSDHLAALTEADRAQLAALDVQRAFDFRGVGERAATPYALDGVTQHSLAIEPTVIQRMQELVEDGSRLTAPVVTELMKDLYRSLVTDQAHRFSELFEHLLASDAPLIIHCTAGKDRTGVAVALVLLALGVPRDVVLQDYLLTNEVYRRPPGERTEIPAEALAMLWQVQEGYLQAALQVVESDHGGIERYFSERLRLSPSALERLAERYLQDDESSAEPAVR